ncbi:UTP--glucose-1-phosphate uridylyltransferase GalU [Paenibacillus sp. 32352]|uniref:UTP--glucose-1-phosphate uridylyltransferase GalU n=1 Tax=Paenibacillus sp. 32352 TaxID=1969111 RepID=UPI0009AE6EA3|nr:UTP--glucose-1-phosphate uridylyltransferase GalU [Paenibacillus sp. 32352]
MKIKKAIIPAAGLGTRFLPATKAMPKEMLPIVDKPTIQYIVEEAVMSGIEDIIIVTGKGKRSIEDHFDNYFELEENLRAKGKLELLSEVQKSSQMADIHYIRQKEPKGLGHAVWCARKFIGNEPFAILLGDDIVQASTPCLLQMMNIFENYNASVVGVQPVPTNEVSRYGIIDASLIKNRLFQIKHLIEKPAIDKAPSNMAVLGRYILTPAIFDILENQEVGTGNEIQLTDAISKLTTMENVFAYQFEGKRYDVGEKLGFIKTSIEFALARTDLKNDLYIYLESLLKDLHHAANAN